MPATSWYSCASWSSRSASKLSRSSLLNVGPGAECGGRSAVALLLDAGGLADAIAEVVQLGPAHVAALDDLHLLDHRAVEGEGALDTHAVAELADLVGLADARALDGDDVALEHLDSLLAGLDHPDVHLQLVTGAERRDVRAQVGCVDEVSGLHGRSSERTAKGRSRIGDGRELFQQPSLVVRQAAAGVDHVGAVATGPMQRLSAPPAGDAPVVAAAQHVGRLPTAKDGGARVLRLLEQPCLAEALRHRADVVAHHARQESGHGFDHQARGDLSPGEDDVADADLAVGQVLTHAVVDALVAPADQAEPCSGRQLVGQRLVEAPPAGAEQQQRARWLSGLDGGEDRLGPHDHPGATAEGSVVDAAVHVGRVLARVVEPEVDGAGGAGLAEQAVAAARVNHLGEDREDVDAHPARLRTPAFLPNARLPHREHTGSWGSLPHMPASSASIAPSATISAALPPPVPLPTFAPAAMPATGAVAVARTTDPPWYRPGLALLTIATAITYLWNLSASGWANSFYSAAAQAGSVSWKAFFFGSLDSASSITVDKPPASLWLMSLSARLFGVSSWSILVPEALCGVATVVVLVLCVKRWFGPAAGLLAGLALAFTPVAALMFRFNNPDALLVLLLTGAAYAVTRAIERAGTSWLLLAGALVGFGFLTKMLQAFIVLPAF